jgi:hypothetical protein
VNAQVGLGHDNIVTLRGTDHFADGGGNWMGIDFVRVHAAGDTGTPATFSTPTISGNNITLNWTGNGTLEWAPTVLGDWTPYSPAPSGTHTEPIVAGQNRFYRIRQ